MPAAAIVVDRVTGNTIFGAEVVVDSPDGRLPGGRTGTNGRVDVKSSIPQNAIWEVRANYFTPVKARATEGRITVIPLERAAGATYAQVSEVFGSETVSLAPGAAPDTPMPTPPRQDAGPTQQPAPVSTEGKSSGPLGMPMLFWAAALGAATYFIATSGDDEDKKKMDDGPDYSFANPIKPTEF